MPISTDLACLLDPVLFAERAGFRADPWQARALRSTATRMLLLASRQSGKSSTVALIAAWTALYEPGSLTLIVAPTERQSKETFRKVVDAFHALHWPVPSEAESAMQVQLANASRVIALPGSGQTIRGYSAPRLMPLDEAAQIPDELLFRCFPQVAGACWPSHRHSGAAAGCSMPGRVARQSRRGSVITCRRASARVSRRQSWRRRSAYSARSTWPASTTASSPTPLTACLVWRKLRPP